ncbi:rRNA maturation RNase YbeY [Campylobacter sp. MIT 21-1685]|uniref:rRNA maturation RNase YbeY n=1 Tax=unclassified Campylobacter TaxID=2593542 RepID=UPI00224AFF0E|nr:MULTISPECIES: rRNA maturation RNase YbeY [unclassified Campylobacter]MCX2683660.1 rRNA maturation RNase YbeY [Campylobacter sp. MIT 21-1684]MCX2751938.1 rRNA maturation RNase YbeY [Campylobacter sp. MIT 21-1682]MCX2808139.1 rRNA maturation RNase YbeY [Campylobacter sp. MIT 21-1685]
MILCEDECGFLEPIAQKLSLKDVELVFVNDEQMKALNFKQRNINQSTDVLSFPLQNISDTLPLGSIVINTDLAKKKACEFGHSFEDELALLFIHAMLHLLGYDHENDKGQMRKKEKECIEFFQLPKSLIIRNEI